MTKGTADVMKLALTRNLILSFYERTYSPHWRQ